MSGRLYERFSSLNTGLWLTLGVALFLGIGSFCSGEGSTLNEMPLFAWLYQAPFSLSWWLRITLAIIFLLVVNTFVCSVDSLRSKSQKGNVILMIAPQVMHLGFLGIVAAHLLSAYGSFKQTGRAYEGMSLRFPDGSAVTLETISASVGQMGMVTAFSAAIRTENGRVEILRPNHPYFHGGYGLYLKDVEPSPAPAAYLELHKEPGGGIALAGALLYIFGNTILLMSRRTR